MRPFDRMKARSRSQGKPKQLYLQVGEYGGLKPTYYAPNDLLDQNEAGATCIQTNALYCSKVEFSSVRITDTGEKIHDYPQLDKLMQYRPNPLMTAAVFWERTAYYYYKYSNAFIYIEKNAFGGITALWSIDPSSVMFDKISTGELLLKFTVNGTQIIIPYSEIVHIPRYVVKDAIFGMNANGPIKRVIDLINLNYTGIENAILTSSFLRFTGEYVTKMSRSELKKKAKEFTEDYLNVKKGDPVGIIFSDSSIKLTPITPAKQATANYVEQNQWNQAVYKFYGCPERVIAGTANEDEMVAYYERTLEPFFMRATQEMTTKLFTQREYDVGNRIVYADRKIQYLSMKTKLQIFTAVRELGAFNLGTLGDLIGLPVPNDKRDIVVTSQNYDDSLEGQKGGKKAGGESKEPEEEEESNDSEEEDKKEGKGNAENG